MNSPWGIEISILKELHWTREYLLWKISWANLQTMIADAPSFKTGNSSSGSEKKGKDLESEEDFAEFLKL
jgi:hypothetical protein